MRIRANRTSRSPSIPEAKGEAFRGEIRTVTRFLALDLGTTFFKGAVLDLEGRRGSHIRRVPTPESIAGLPPGRCELDPAAVLAAVRRLIGSLLADAPDASGLVMSSQMHCVVLTDDAGRAHSNIVTWKDQRAREPQPDGGTLFDGLTARLSPEDHTGVGRELRVGTPAATLFWMQRHGGLRPGATPAALPDFVLADLCGTQPTTDATNAAAHGLFDLARGDWHRDLIGRLGLGALRWPEVRPFGSVVGVAGALICYAPVGDQQAALAGVGVRDRELSINISTGSQISLTGRDVGSGDFQVRPYFDGRRLRTIVGIPAGRSLAVLVDLLTEIGRGGTDAPDPWDAIAAAVERVGESDLEVNLAFFASAVGDRGSIGNIREGNLTVGGLFAAAFRSMAENYARFAAALSPDRDWDRVVFSGGVAAKFPRLRREILRALGDPPARLSETEDDALDGLLAIARVCAGFSAAVGG